MELDHKEKNKIPVTVLTGYLGAGKTTLLNRILTEQQDKKYAVIVNEYGELGIDNDLIVDADEEIFEMSNGCVCCTIRGDLVRILNKLIQRQRSFDGIIIETTGLADPAPVAQTFFVDEDIRNKTRLDAVIAVIDAFHVMKTLDESKEAVNQIAFADVILLNKVDLVDRGSLIAIKKRIRTINPMVALYEMEKGNISLMKILDLGGFDLNRALTLEPKFLSSHDHDHDHDHVQHSHGDGVTSISLMEDKPLDGKRFNLWMSMVLQKFGKDILRTKGIMNFKHDDRCFAFQAVHMMAEGNFIRSWKTKEDRCSRLVFIGRNLDEKSLREGFFKCID